MRQVFSWSVVGAALLVALALGNLQHAEAATGIGESAGSLQSSVSVHAVDPDNALRKPAICTYASCGVAHSALVSLLDMQELQPGFRLPPMAGPIDSLSRSPAPPPPR